MTGSITNRGGTLRGACIGAIAQGAISVMTGSTGVVMGPGISDNVTGMTADTGSCCAYCIMIGNLMIREVSIVVAVTCGTVGPCFNHMAGGITNCSSTKRAACAGTIKQTTVTCRIGMTGGTGVAMGITIRDNITSMAAETACGRT
jgi:hypothetical protein